MNEQGPMKLRIRENIDEIMAIASVTGCAVVSKDGAVIGKSFADDVPVPAFAVMSATVFASSEAAATIIHLNSPSLVVTEAEDGYLVMAAAGGQAFIIAVLDGTADVSSVKGRLTEIAGNIGEEL
jgi:predicted regulator of Ras-like GTPase activity (Roadblock/LC7/MglB family)